MMLMSRFCKFQKTKPWIIICKERWTSRSHNAKFVRWRSPGRWTKIISHDIFYKWLKCRSSRAWNLTARRWGGVYVAEPNEGRTRVSCLSARCLSEAVESEAWHAFLPSWYKTWLNTTFLATEFIKWPVICQGTENLIKSTGGTRPISSLRDWGARICQGAVSRLKCREPKAKTVTSKLPLPSVLVVSNFKWNESVMLVERKVCDGKEEVCRWRSSAGFVYYPIEVSQVIKS